MNKKIMRVKKVKSNNNKIKNHKKNRKNYF